MARFTYTKTVEHYSFNPPTSISEEEYNLLKLKIMINPDASLIDEEAQQKSHDKLTTILMVGIVFLIIGLIGMFAFEEPKWWGVLLTIISTFGVLHPIVNMGQLESSKNLLKAEQARINYFRNLKDLVQNSKSYTDFHIAYQLRYGRFY
jgi:hypothetical protein